MVTNCLAQKVLTSTDKATPLNKLPFQQCLILTCLSKVATKTILEHKNPEF